MGDSNNQSSTQFSGSVTKMTWPTLGISKPHLFRADTIPESFSKGDFILFPIMSEWYISPLVLKRNLEIKRKIFFPELIKGFYVRMMLLGKKILQYVPV